MNWLARWCIRCYRATLAHGIGGQCRFYPSCSTYALEAFAEHPFWRACNLTVVRIAKCHPRHPGGIDMVPTKNHEG